MINNFNQLSGGMASILFTEHHNFVVSFVLMMLEGKSKDGKTASVNQWLLEIDV